MSKIHNQCRICRARMPEEYEDIVCRICLMEKSSDEIRVTVANTHSKVSVERPFPEHDKVRAIKDQSQSIMEFIDWLYHTHKIHLCEREVNGGTEEYFPTGKQYLRLVAQFFEIDETKLENEKRQMLIDMRTENARRDAEKELLPRKR